VVQRRNPRDVGRFDCGAMCQQKLNGASPIVDRRPVQREAPIEGPPQVQ
jgi:hypothetical protein